MKLQYLGTAAAEAIPGLFCGCETCRRARKLGGRNLRTRSQALVDGVLMIDFPPDTVDHMLRFGLDLSEIRWLLVTHIHEDHWNPLDLRFTKPGFSAPPENWPGLHIFGSEDLRPDVEKLQKDGVSGIFYTAVEPFKPFALGKYTVTALKAWHGSAHPYNYIISDGEKTLLYDHDSDVFNDETYAYLKSAGVKFDFVSMDCTSGAEEDMPYRGHMCLGRNRICRQMLLDIGAADENTVFAVNHFSHNGKDACYDDLLPQAEAMGFAVSYDGMEIVI